VDRFKQHPEEEHTVTHTYRNRMKCITVENVMEKVSLALERYGGPEE
jgi:hypothetical protein